MVKFEFLIVYLMILEATEYNVSPVKSHQCKYLSNVVTLAAMFELEKRGRAPSGVVFN